MFNRRDKHSCTSTSRRSLTINSIEYPDADVDISGEDFPDDLDALLVRFPLSEAGSLVEIHRPFVDWAWRMQDPESLRALIMALALAARDSMPIHAVAVLEELASRLERFQQLWKSKE